MKVNLQGEAALRDAIDARRLTPAKRRRVVGKVRKVVMRSTKKRLTKKRTLDGKKFKGRADGKRKALLPKLKKKLIKQQKGEGEVITWGSKLTAQIAKRQQDGIDETMTARKMDKIHGNGETKKATVHQARALKKLGYKIPVKNPRGKKRKWRKPTLEWIKSNLTRKQAGVIIRALRDNAATKKTWNLPGTSRPFLGANKSDILEAVEVIRQTLKE